MPDSSGLVAKFRLAVCDLLTSSCRLAARISPVFSRIWLLAAIGAVVGIGHYQGAVALAVVTVAVLVGVELLESSVKWLTRGAHKREDD